MSRPCRMCGRRLTRPAPDGIGPVCARKLHHRPAVWPGHTQPALEEPVTTTPDTERRERYAAAEAAWRGINFWEMSAHGRGLFLEQNRGRIDAVMAVADQELTRVREELDEANRRHENFKMGATFGGTEMRKRLTEAEDALRTQAAEVRAAAFDQAADAVQSDGVRLNTAATEAAARRGPVALIAHVQAAVAAELRRMAARWHRRDNTTGA